MGTEAFFLPVEPVAQGPVILAEPIAAIQVLPARENGLLRLGLLSRLPAGAVLHICGDGFDKLTAKVLVDGQYYFVFREEIGWPQLAETAISHGLHCYVSKFIV
jgi:hypothetical protein